MPGVRIAVFIISALLASLPVAAHEFWVAPEIYRAQPGQPVPVGLKVGQMMKGQDYPFLSDKFYSFTVTGPLGAQKAEGFDGDIPALTLKAAEPGLHVISHHALPFPITFDTLAEFDEYLAYEGLKSITAAHTARGLPPAGITERYIRCAKGLVQVGPVQEGQTDKPVGLPFELVAEVNPYAQGLAEVPVVLTWQGQPVAGRQISVFQRNGEVTRSLVTTDAAGRAVIPLAGGGEFLLNAVQMEPVEGGEAMWESHWASLTFGLPPQP